MKSAVIDSDSVSAIKWEDNYFKFCNFEGFSVDGKVIDSDFVNCSFKNVDWYWGEFIQANFISCEFIDCEFRGSSFPDARFIECTLGNVKFTQDNLGKECDFARAIAYGCKVTGGEGFMGSANT
jgi:uncharacterized protein YjbI with pentapeptide repeats